MAAIDVVTYALAQKYVQETANSLGSLRGAPCTIRSVAQTDEGNIVTFAWTGADGTEQTQTALFRHGPAGADGKDYVLTDDDRAEIAKMAGAAGVESIQQVQESSEDGGENIWRMTLSDGTQSDLTVRNGQRGETGDTGPQGPKGSDATVTSANIQSALGYTPASAAAVSQLSEKIKDLCEPSEDMNLIPTAIDENGSVFYGCGYVKGYRVANDGSIVALDDAVLTGFIPYTHDGKTIRISGAIHQANDYGNHMAAYNSSFELISANYLFDWIYDYGGSTEVDNNNVKTFIVNAGNIDILKDAAYIRISLRPCMGRSVNVQYI